MKTLISVMVVVGFAGILCSGIAAATTALRTKIEWLKRVFYASSIVLLLSLALMELARRAQQ